MTRKSGNSDDIGLKLRAVHVRSAGPEKARFDPLTLDFTSDGEAADKVLLHLVNTGGKTTLIRLVSSVVVPAAKDQVGKANLGEYVGAGDTAHVVLLWDTESGPLVTGVVAEWPQRIKPASGNMSELVRRWYKYHLDGDGTSPEDLPFESIDDSGKRRRRTAADFMARLGALMQEHPSARYQAVQSQADWQTLLEEQTPIDPALWRMQMRMNDVETGASALISKFSSPEAVVHFFLTALNDSDALRDFTDTLTTYAQAAAKRETHELEAAFCEDMRQALNDYAHAAAQAAETAAAAEVARIEVAELAGALDTRIRSELAATERAKSQHEQAAQALASNDKEFYRLEDHRQQLSLELARLDLNVAADELASAQEALEEAKDNAEAWLAVPLVNDRAAAAARLRTASAEFEKAEGVLSPLREAATAAGADLAAKLESLARESDEAVAREDQGLQEARRQRDDAVSAQSALSTETRKLDSELATLNGVVSSYDSALKKLRESGACGPAETPAEAANRHTSAAQEQRAAALEAGGKLEDLQRLGVEARAAEDSAQKSSAQADIALAKAEQEFERYENARKALGVSEIVASIADLPPNPDIVTGPETAEALADSASTLALEADRLARDAQTKIDRIDPEIRALEQTDYAAPAEEVTSVAQFLVDAGVGAVTGVSWIVANLATPAERAALLAVHPEFGTSVVVSDVRQIGRAQELLNDGSVAGRVPVLVCGPDRLQNPDNGTSDSSFVVQPRKALTDPDGAKELLEQLRRDADNLNQQREVEVAREKSLRSAESSLRRFALEWQGRSTSGLADDLEKATRGAAAAAASLAAARALTAGIVTDSQSVLQDKSLAERAADAIDRIVERCQEVELARAAAAIASTKALEITTALKQAEQAHESLVAAAASAQAQADTAQQKMLHYRAQGSTFRRQLDEVKLAPAGVVPAQTLDELEARYAALRARLSAEESGSDHAPLLERAQAEDAAMASKLSQLGEKLVKAATLRAGQLEAADADALKETQRLSAEERDQAQKRVVYAEVRKERAEGEVKERSPKNRTVHVSLPTDWDVSTKEAVEVHYTRVLAEIANKNARRIELEGEVRRQSDLVSAATGAYEKLLAARGTVPDQVMSEGVPSGIDTYSGEPSEAQARVRALLNKYEEARVVSSRARQNCDAAWSSVRLTAVASKWASLTSSIKTRCENSPPEEVAVHAAAWVQQLDARIISLEQDLAELDTHRDQLVTRLASLCDTQRRLLNDVTRQSALPQGLGALSGQPAFKISFDALPIEEAKRLLTARVDSWASEIASAQGRRVRGEERFRWLADALGDTVRNRPQSGRFHVQVLKPSIDGVVDYRAPDRVAKEYSGGQELTLAVMLYCTLAAVRSGHRTSGVRPPGVLLLDNPFGAASNPRLIELQQALARRAGVQLVCATGLNDASVKHAFDGGGGVVVSLRNDRDQRRGLQYLRVRDPEFTAVAVESIRGSRSVDDPAGYIDAATYQVIDAARGGVE